MTSENEHLWPFREKNAFFVIEYHIFIVKKYISTVNETMDDVKSQVFRENQFVHFFCDNVEFENFFCRCRIEKEQIIVIS